MFHDILMPSASYVDLPVLGNARRREAQALQTAGATEVVPETLEASLMLSSRCCCSVPVSRVVKTVGDIRNNCYALLRRLFSERPSMPMVYAKNCNPSCCRRMHLPSARHWRNELPVATVTAIRRWCRRSPA
jgi:hypothetical protein